MVQKALVLPFARQIRPGAAEPDLDQPRPLGAHLLSRGTVTAGQLDAALRLQSLQGGRLGDTLVASGVIDRRGLGDALAAQAGLARISLDETPPDPALAGTLDAGTCLANRVVPWRRFGRFLLLAVDDPAAVTTVAALPALQGQDLSFALTDPDELDMAISGLHGDHLAEQAELRCPPAFSCRTWAYNGRPAPLLVLACLALATLLFPVAALLVALAVILALNLSTTLLRLAALRASLPAAGLPDGRPDAVARISDHRARPRVSVLVPLYREQAVAADLVAAIARSTWPKALLDVILVLEADDAQTARALAAVSLPPWMRLLKVPAGVLRTKPRAMNYALPFCRGEIIGIYDAEDRPDPDQIDRMVAHLAASPREVACVQGYLDFYNSGQNWLSRCFAIEYAMWFRIQLQGVQRLGILIPLGGTSVFFRRAALQEIGGWDAHNVTEDADLGIRLARLGYRCEMVPTVTLEEANCRLRPWIGQRARWLKGYAMTWFTHSRHPLRLWRDLGPRGFIGMQTLLLGSVMSYLAQPLLWLVWLGALAGAPIMAGVPGPAIQAYAGVTLAGEVLLFVLAIIATQRLRRPGLWLAIPTLPAYFLLGSVAAWRGLAESFTRPFHWTKTEHGLARHPDAQPQPLVLRADWRTDRAIGNRPAVLRLQPGWRIGNS
jgi:cellulose synthase/poly-beta-1,6-N-acetylglucosamine synthase-like glycosyltransferase